MRHLVVYEAANSSTYPTALTAQTDNLFPVSGNSYLVPFDIYIQSVTGIGSNLNRLEISSPSIAATCPISIPHFNTAGAYGPNLPAVFVPPAPIRVPQGEVLSVNASCSSSTPDTFCVIELSENSSEPADPLGPTFSLRGTSTTSSVAKAWTTISVTWENASLPGGTYVATGLNVVSNDGIACRLYYPGFDTRPGSLMVGQQSYQNHPSFGVRGGRQLLTFSGQVLPSVEVYTSTIDTSFVCHLFFKR